MNIVVLDGYVANPGDLSWESLERLGNLTVYVRTKTADEVVARSKGAEAIFVNKVLLTASVIDRLDTVKFIGVLATGYNNVDLVAARSKGIVVCNVPAYSSDSVAQTVFALLLELTNRTGQYSRSVAKGDWTHSPDFSYTLGATRELAGLTMGIYGFGSIGSRVGRIADAFGLHVITPTSKSQDELPQYVEKVTFEHFLTRSDIISINAPLTEENRHLFNAETFSKVKDGVLLINTARGPIVDEAALAEALRSGKVGGAGLDVLEQEPPRGDNPLFAPDLRGKCLITPHIAWQSQQARRRLLEITASNLAAFIEGKPQNCVN